MINGVNMFNKYYENNHIRDVCHGVKELDHIAIMEMAEYMLNLDMITQNSILIPAPQHIGCAVYTKQIADMIAKETKAQVKDVLKCDPHEMLYTQKLKGKLFVPKFYLTETIEGNELFFIDNVIATGTTYKNANKLFNGKMQPIVYAVV